MKKSKKVNDNIKKMKNILPITAIAVTLIAVMVINLNPNSNAYEKYANNNVPVINESIATDLNDSGDVVINVADITEEATFLDYTSKDGTTVGLFAVRASDGTVRTALNTCQVCKGSPYAYFEQQEDVVQCKNCGNLFGLDMIEQVRGGCNPIPITAEEKTMSDTEIIIPSEFLEDNSSIFENWKKF